MKDLSTVSYFPPVEKLADILCAKTQNTNPLFFRIAVSYYLAKVASMMRCDIKFLGRGTIPVGMYALNLASSGEGKGHSTSIMEEQVLFKFKAKFLSHTYGKAIEKNIAKTATSRARINGTDDVKELEIAQNEFDRCGPLLFSFDSGTTPAIKQMRHKLLLGAAGSINLEIDEIGANLLGQQDILIPFLELFDIGRLKPKLIKNTKESIRDEEIDGRTPTNMLLYGTPAGLLDGGKTEDELNSMLDQGYARRCIFGYSGTSSKNIKQSVQDTYDALTNPINDQYLEDTANHLGKLADFSHFNHQLEMTQPVAMDLLTYKRDCEIQADGYPDHEEARKAELSHRYFKAMKLAGAYAYYEQSNDIQDHHLWAAIKLVEDSGKAFDQILTRDKAYVKLAKYIANIGHEVTHADMAEDLPFYPLADNQRRSIIELAIAWGYKNNVIVKKTYADNIEFFSGESLQETSMDSLLVSSSDHLAQGYVEARIKWEDMPILTQTNGYHFINHIVVDGHRKEVNCVPGFNLIVIDVDHGISVNTAMLLLEPYKYFIYTTKRHTDAENRFRIIFPMSHEVKLNTDDYKEYMSNFFDSLPFEVDRQTNQRSRKWLANAGNYHFHDGALVDALAFIPKTTKSETRQKQVAVLQDLDATERWFAMNTKTGDRSNKLVQYAYMLVDSGRNLIEVTNQVLGFNAKLVDSLPEAEILNTILVTAAAAITERDLKDVT